MIKFFRNIRQTLLKGNDPNKAALPANRYFKYALGEIILVVIGILIALGINNLNQDRLSENLEIEYYKRLLEDVREEKSILESTINYSKQVSFHAKKGCSIF